MTNNFFKLCALPAVAFLAACTTSPTASVNDSDVYRIDCGTTSRGLSECFQRAGRTCGAEGFSIIRSDGTVVASSNVGGLESQAAVVMSAMDNNVMLVTCGD